jgi:uncharacterized integral membrane protein (TIGR00697 family)
MQNEFFYILHLFLILGATVAAFLCGRSVLTAFIYILVVCANIFVGKKLMLMGMSASGSDMYIVGSMCGILLLQSVWGHKYAMTVLKTSFVFAGLLWVFSWFQCQYAPLEADWAGPLFDVLLGGVWRVTLASIVAHGVAQITSLFVQKTLFVLHAASWLAHFCALAVGQVVDSSIFFAGAFYGQEPASIIAEMVVMSVIMKSVMIAAGTFVVTFAHRLREGNHE